VELINLWLSFFGNIASIFGLFITIAVWYGVRSLKSFYVSKATIPNQLKELAELREKIEELFSGKFDAANRDKAIEYSSAAHLNIKNLLPKLKDMDKSQYSEQIEPNATNFIHAYGLFIQNPIKESARVMNMRLFEFLRSTELVMNEENWRHTQ